jgi:hypothetical protein
MSSSTDPQPPPTPDAYLLGAPVRIQGLQKAPDLNGQRGTVKGYDETSGRYKVTLQQQDGVATTKQIKATNLSELPLPEGTVVLVMGLVSAVELSDKEARVQTYTEGAEMPYTVKLLAEVPGRTTDQPFKLRRANLVPRRFPEAVATPRQQLQPNESAELHA